MIFQDPMTSLNPVYTVGDQIVEAIRAHRDVSKQEAMRQAVELLKRSGSRLPRSAYASTRTSSRAACASGR